MRLLLLALLAFPLIASANEMCSPVLWRAGTFSVGSKPVLIDNLQKWAKKALKAEPHAIPVLASAGKLDIHDTQLEDTRTAFKDADHAAVLALAFAMTHNPTYLQHTRDILVNWANINKPTGHPIDETRLEGLVWAYDLVHCDLNATDNTAIQKWLTTLRTQKVAWHFVPATTNNNHRINQLKMILLIDKVLHQTADWQHDLAIAKQYSTINLNSITGESVDYRQRHALHYHNYDLAAWLEIRMISGCCDKPTRAGFQFLSQRILTHDIGGEFLHSTAKIDALRAQGGFAYAKTGGLFNTAEAAPTIVTYYTIDTHTPPGPLWTIVQEAKPSPWLAFVLARRALSQHE